MATKYPAWAPKELREYHKNWVLSSPCLKNDAFYVLETLITDPRMKPIWKKLKGLDTKNLFEFYLLMQNTKGPIGAGKLTRAELRREVQRIEKKSKQLADLIDEVMPMCFIEGLADEGKYTLVTPIIKNLGTQAKQLLNGIQVLNKPGSKFVERTYFIRLLSAFFEETFDDPMTNTVAELHLIFMPEDEQVGAGDVKSILRDSPLKTT